MVLLRNILLTGFILFLVTSAFAQIESVRVETYYISDAADATDTMGGMLENQSTTYRLFIDLQPNTRILSIYGDLNHPLVISSTKPFFNHREEGVTFGKDLNRNRYSSGTAPLDSYLTIGQCSKSFGQGAYYGIPKESDQDGSLVGGVNNDGGSENISGGLLINDDPGAGIPITIADGLTTATNAADSWIEIGFKDIVSEEDTTIFGSGEQKLKFYSTNSLLRNSGVAGIDPVKNEILIAQLTTKGDISFELNLELEIVKEGVPGIVKYVARNEELSNNEIFSPLLKFPYTCGCTDPDYLEASTIFACTDNSKCIKPIILGCTDSLACNFNPKANKNLQDLCCYVGFCYDRDISLVCPNLQPRIKVEQVDMGIFPNPAFESLYIEFSSKVYSDIQYTIHNILGHEVLSGSYIDLIGTVDIKNINHGTYIIQVKMNDRLFTKPFIKL